jgi:hypothetical protein
MTPGTIATSPKESPLLFEELTWREFKAVDELFRANAKIIGGTAGAIIYERITGNLVGGKSHSQKGRRRAIQLQKIIEKETLTAEDLAIAENLLDDLQDASNLNP